MSVLNDLKLSECYPSGSETAQKKEAQTRRKNGLVHDYQGTLHGLKGQQVTAEHQVKSALASGTRETIDREIARYEQITSDITRIEAIITVLGR